MKKTTDQSQEHRLEVLDVASQAAAAAIRLSAQLTGTLRSQADQLVRSATSAVNNLAEGDGRRGRARVHHLEVAYGSVREARVIVVYGCARTRGEAGRCG